MLLQRRAFELFADYFQFYVWDCGTDVWDSLYSVAWTDEDVRRRLIAAPYMVVVQPERNMDVPVELEIHDAEPPYDADSWDHIAECGLELPTGRLEVHECTGDSVARIEVEPGEYRLRSLHAGLGTLSPNGLYGDDHYRVALWPSWPGECRALKQWTCHGPAPQ